MDTVEQRRREQMSVHPTDAAAPERRAFDQSEDLAVLGDARGVERLKAFEYVGSRGDGAEGDLPQDERVHDDAILFEEAGKPGVTPAPVIDPNRRVGEDNHGILTGRGAAGGEDGGGAER